MSPPQRQLLLSGPRQLPLSRQTNRLMTRPTTRNGNLGTSAIVCRQRASRRAIDLMIAPPDGFEKVVSGFGKGDRLFGSGLRKCAGEGLYCDRAGAAVPRKMPSDVRHTVNFLRGFVRAGREAQPTVIHVVADSAARLLPKATEPNCRDKSGAEKNAAAGTGPRSRAVQGEEKNNLSQIRSERLATYFSRVRMDSRRKFS